MLAAIVIVILIAGAIGIFVSAKDRAKPAPLRKLLRGIATALLVAVPVVAVLSSLYRVDVGESTVIRSIDGTVSRIDSSPGFGLKAPWESKVSFDIRNNVVAFASGNEVNSEGGSMSEGPITAQTSDNATAVIDATIRYSIEPDSVGDLYADYRTQEAILNRLVLPGLRSVIRDIPINYPASELRQQRVQVSTDVLTTLREEFERNGIIIEEVDLRDIVYPEEIEQSLSAIQTARSRVETARADLETSKIDAEKIKTEAQAQSDADQIIRCGAQTSVTTQVIGGKKQQVNVITPVPNEQCQDRLNEQVLTNRYIDMLRQAAESGNTVYVIPEDQNSLLNIGGGASRAAAPATEGQN